MAIEIVPPYTGILAKVFSEMLDEAGIDRIAVTDNSTGRVGYDSVGSASAWAGAGTWWQRQAGALAGAAPLPSDETSSSDAPKAVRRAG